MDKSRIVRRAELERIASRVLLLRDKTRYAEDSDKVIREALRLRDRAMELIDRSIHLLTRLQTERQAYVENKQELLRLAQTRRLMVKYTLSQRVAESVLNRLESTTNHEEN